ncbi:MAG: hypothetical protein LUD72_09450 [Bacteroidales bacterium]|nr:hypothetical protein [Bacteroidales bacterium]
MTDMGMELVTGYYGHVHVTSEQEADLYRGAVGDGILNVGSMMEVSIDSNTQITILDGVCVMDGREFYIGYGDKETLTIGEGTSDMNRNDLIVIQYDRNPDDQTESAKFVVIQGAASSTAVDPSYDDEDIRTGVYSAQKAFARVRIEGLSVAGVDILVGSAPALGNLLDTIYPVGSIYMSTTNVNPGKFLGGTWVAWGSGRVPVGVNESDSDFSAAEKTGGSKTVTLTTAQLPSHTHSIPALSGTAASAGAHRHGLYYFQNYTQNGSNQSMFFSQGDHTVSGSNIMDSSGSHTHSVTTTKNTSGSNGSGNSHTNLQPYITCYMWNRTA